ncbi:hypothetical protein [Arsenicibacter rosenii]|uniref:Uncharacterized protein n=1 Tax=Arsenicibacter rosenii TaxID=1750698 RepID=A0A1S2VAF7_9BACT|nr:hypothetical protein [Arsenicibacter rosenii]OIN55639.1 hypothetical protein BLX24_29080 [Arsenicibacter rosenii]
MKKTNGSLLRPTYFEYRIELFDQALSEAFANWQRWDNRLKWFESRPKIVRFLLGGWATRKILTAGEQSAADLYWSIQLEYT